MFGVPLGIRGGRIRGADVIDIGIGGMLWDIALVAAAAMAAK